MKFGKCPECESKIKRQLFKKIECLDCKAQLKVSKVTIFIKVSAPVLAVLFVSLIAALKTREIVLANANPSQAAGMLAEYYIQVYSCAFVTAAVVVLAIRQFFTLYEIKN